MKILAFDVESCTGNPWDGSLCSLGYVLFENGKNLGSGDILVNPLPRFFTLGKFGREPNIKLAYPFSVFRSQPRFNARYCEIKALFDQAELVLGFSPQNDMKYLNNACDKFLLPRFDFEFLDVQLLAGLVIPECKNLGLKAVATRFGIDFTEHRSDEDARATYEIFVKLIETSGETLNAVTEKYGIVYGKNGQDGHVNCYSLEEVKKRLEGGSRSVKKILVNYYGEHAAEFIAPRGNYFKGSKVNVSENVYLNDLLSARKIVATAVAEGGIYEPSLTDCDYFIAAMNDKLAERVKKINRRCKVMSIEEFAENVGGLTDCGFDDLTALTAHYAATVSDRETPAETAARLAKNRGNRTR